jgi:hypothetical protein
MQATHAAELDAEKQKHAAASAQHAAVEKALQQGMDEATKELETAKEKHAAASAQHAAAEEALRQKLEAVQSKNKEVIGP